MSIFAGCFAIAAITGCFYAVGLALLMNSGRISREEEERNDAYSEHSIHCACEGALEGDLRSFVVTLNAGKIDV